MIAPEEGFPSNSNDQLKTKPKFSYLKKGQGTHKYSSIPYSKPKSAPVALKMSDGGSKEPGEETGDRSILSDTRQFEILEQAIDQSLPSHSQLFRQFTNNQPLVSNTNPNQSTPVPSNSNASKSSLRGDTSVESGSVSTVGSGEWPVMSASHKPQAATQNEQSPAPQMQMPPSLSTNSTASTMSSASISASAVPETQPMSYNRPRPEAFSTEHFAIPGPMGGSVPMTSDPMGNMGAPMTFDPRLATCLAQVKQVMQQLNQDYIHFQQSRDTMVEYLKETAREFEEMKNKKEQNLQEERKNFEKVKQAELQDLRTSREALQKQRNAIEKRESERVVKLKQELVELQNDVCERDSRISSLRTKQRAIEDELKRKKESLIEADVDRERLRDRCRSLETANAQLRIKEHTEKDSLKSRASKENLDPLSKPCTKSVRFASIENKGPFMRSVQNQSMDSSFLEPESAYISGKTATQNVRNIGALSIELEDVAVNGSNEKHYKNGTVVEQNHGCTVFKYANGDTRSVATDGTETYFYSATQMTTITYPTGIQVIKHKDGRQETHTTLDDGSKQTLLQDGTTIVTHFDGAQTCTFPDSTKEYRCKQFKRREWPSGDVKIVYSDGTEETRYKDGRVRVKDAHNNVIRYEYQ